MCGFGYTNTTKTGVDTYHDYSFVDKVLVPSDIVPGAYLVSWRWDAGACTFHSGVDARCELTVFGVCIT